MIIDKSRYSLPKFNLLALIGILLALIVNGKAAVEGSKERLLCGWYLWDPYQYLQEGAGFEKLTGLDVELVKAIADKAGYMVVYEHVNWQQHIKDLKGGNRDLAAGASYSQERAEFTHYSIPYRKEENAFYVRRGDAHIYSAFASDIQRFLEYVKEENLKVGVIPGFVYAHPALNEFIRHPDNAKYIVESEDDFKNLQLLLEGKIDGFLADRIVASTAIWRMKVTERIEEVFLNISVPIHLMFSKKNIDEETVKKFNVAIQAIKDSGEYGKIVNDYLFPVLLLQTIERPWFLIIDIIGTIAFAISGLILAYHQKNSVIGAFVMAALPSVGGGVLRDLLVNRPQLGIMLTPMYLFLILATVTIAYLFIRFRSYYISIFPYNTYRKKLSANTVNRIVDICDALGLAAFTITGVIIAVSSKLEPLWLWGPLLASITGAGGGILRDILRSDRQIKALQGEFYAEVSAAWGGALSLFLIWQRNRISPEEIFWAIICVLILTFLTRLLVIIFDIKSLAFGEQDNLFLTNNSSREKKPPDSPSKP